VVGKSYMRKAKQRADLTKPCRCGSGFYCHRHLRYGVEVELTPKLFKIKKKAKPKYRPSNGREH
jgi:hypothetical protein